MKKLNLILTGLIAITLIFSSCAKKAEQTAKEVEKEKTVDVSSKEETKTPQKSSETKKEDVQNNAQTKEEKSADVKKEEPKSEEKAAKKSVDLQSIRSDIISKLSISQDDAMMIETSSLADLYGISANSVKQSASFVTMAGTFPHEIVMIEAVNDSAAAEIGNKLQNKLNEVLNQSKTYDADNYALAQKCKVERNGNFVSMFLSPSYYEMSKIYNNAINN